jgi:hypothetical protein
MGLAVTALLTLLSARPCLAAGDDAAPIDWLVLFVGLPGRLAMPLFGMDQLSEGLEAAAGDPLEVEIRRLAETALQHQMERIGVCEPQHA